MFSADVALAEEEDIVYEQYRVFNAKGELVDEQFNGNPNIGTEEEPFFLDDSQLVAPDGTDYIIGYGSTGDEEGNTYTYYRVTKPNHIEKPNFTPEPAKEISKTKLPDEKIDVELWEYAAQAPEDELIPIIVLMTNQTEVNLPRLRPGEEQVAPQNAETLAERRQLAIEKRAAGNLNDQWQARQQIEARNEFVDDSFWLINAFSAECTFETILELAELDEIDMIQLDSILETADPHDSMMNVAAKTQNMFLNRHGYSGLRPSSLYNPTIGGSGPGPDTDRMLVAVIEPGIFQLDHLAFSPAADRIMECWNCNNAPCFGGQYSTGSISLMNNPSSSYNDEFGYFAGYTYNSTSEILTHGATGFNHATRVAGTLMGSIMNGQDPNFQLTSERTNRSGVAYNADVIFINNTFGGEAATVRAIQKAAELGVDVLNMSFGQGCPSAGSPAASGRNNASLAANAAHAEGVMVVAAAGNDGDKSCPYRVMPPAAAVRVIAVGSLYSDHDDPKTDFNNPYIRKENSSYGPTEDGRVKPELMAPTNISLRPKHYNTANYNYDQLCELDLFFPHSDPSDVCELDLEKEGNEILWCTYELEGNQSTEFGLIGACEERNTSANKYLSGYDYSLKYRGDPPAFSTGCDTRSSGTSTASPVIAGAVANFKDWMIAYYGQAVANTPNLMFATILNLGDRRVAVEEGESYSREMLSDYFGAGRIRNRQFDSAGMDFPFQSDSFSVRVYSRTVTEINLGWMLGTVDFLKMMIWWHDVEEEINDRLAVEATLVIGGNSYFKSSGPTNPDNKIHFIFDSSTDDGGLIFTDLPSTLTNVKLRLTIDSNQDLYKDVYVSYFREDTARDDGDGPCTSAYVTYGDIADQCNESGESYTAPNWTCNQNNTNYLFFR